MTTRVVRPRIAVCFYGIPRSLRFTHASIEENVLAPLRSLGEVKVYAHFFRQTSIANPRTGEFGKLDAGEYRFLQYDELEQSDPNIGEVQELFDDVSPFGSAWKGDLSTLSNLCHQLVSLRRVTTRALADGHDLYVLLRPDLMYHDSLLGPAEVALRTSAPHIFTPSWQENGGGLNDRFCLARGDEAARICGLRADRALEYCETFAAPLPAEALFGFAASGMPRSNVLARASRIRFDGSYRNECFDVAGIARAVKCVKRTVPQPGLREVAIKLLRFAQALRYGPRYGGLRIPPNAQRSRH